MTKTALFVTFATAAIGAGITVIIAKAQTQPKSWLLNNQWVVPTIFGFAALFLLLALRDWGAFQKLFWTVACFIMPKPVFRKKQPLEMTDEGKAVAVQLGRLSRFQVEAIRQLALTGGMTSDHFYVAVKEFGFPIQSRAVQDDVCETFDRINGVTLLLEIEPQSKLWRLRPEVKEHVAHLLPKTPPIF